MVAEQFGRGYAPNIRGVSVLRGKMRVVLRNRGEEGRVARPEPLARADRPKVPRPYGKTPERREASPRGGYFKAIFPGSVLLYPDL